MSYSLYSFIWPLIALLFGGLQITAAALLLRERGSGSWLMLIGGIVSVVGHVAIPIIVFFFNSGGSDPIVSTLFVVLPSFATLGSLIFAIGLLLHALRRRALGSRIAELESILAATHEARADRP